MTEGDLSYDRSLLGVEHHVGTFGVTRQMIVAFARATGEVDPAYGDATGSESDADGPVAPPTFCNVFTAEITRPDIKLEFGDTGFFAGQSIECGAAVRPGDTLDVTTTLKDVYAKTGRSGKMAFAVWETRFTNQRGETAALVQESFVRRNRSPE
jgi:acyl dehydratase